MRCEMSERREKLSEKIDDERAKKNEKKTCRKLPHVGDSILKKHNLGF